MPKKKFSRKQVKYLETIMQPKQEYKKQNPYYDSFTKRCLILHTMLHVIMKIQICGQ